MGYVLFVGSIDNFGTNTNDEILQEEDILVIYTMMMVDGCNTHNLLNPNELEEGGQLIVDHNVVVTDAFSACERCLRCSRFRLILRFINLMNLLRLCVLQFMAMPIAQVLREL